MKKLIVKSVCIAFFGAALFAAATASAQTTTIYSDSFGYNGYLNGTTPTVTSGTLGGTAGATWTDPNSVFYTYGGATTWGNNYGVAYLPFAAQSGEIYTLSATLAPTGNYAGIGFMQNLGTFGNLQSAFPEAGPLPFVNLNTDNTLQILNWTTSSWVTLGTGTQGSLYSITLDTTGANWTFSVSGAGITTPTVYTLAANSIAGIGIESGLANSTIGNVSLTAAVPEPSTWAMLLGGLGMLTMFRRRRA